MRSTLPALFATLLLSAAATATPFRDDARGLLLDVPAGYQDAPNPPPRAIHAWSRGDVGAPDYSAIVLQGLGGTIGREPLDRAVVERSTRDSIGNAGVTVTGFDYGTVRWRSFDLELVTTRVTAEGQNSALFAVQVPLAPEAVQVMLSGPASGEARMRADLAHVLDSLHGRSNWLTVRERSEKLGSLIGFGIVVLAAAGVAWWLRRPRRVDTAD